MSGFWVIAALMVAGAVLAMVPALLRKTTILSSDTEQENIAIARERMSELETELASGAIAPETFEQAKNELEQGLLEDVAAGTGSGRRESAALGRSALVAVLIFIPALTFGLYQVLGSPRLLDVVGPGAVANPHATGTTGKTPTMAELLVSLEQRTAEQPEDPEAWYMLGRVYSSMGRYQDAAQALERLRELTDNHPVALVALADALAMTNAGRISGRPYELVKQALDTEPDNVTALWLAGKGAREAGDFQNALYYWRRAESGLADNPEMLGELRGQIAGLQGEAQAAGMELDDPGPMVVEAAAGKGIRLTVSLDSALAERAQPGDTLFIFAKAVDGPPMPVAALRHQAGELPLQLLLDDSALLSGGSLADYPQLKLGARITKGGQPGAKSGDLQSAEVIVAPGSDEAVELRIDQVVP